MECPECQLEVPDESNFCNRCGCRLTESIDVEQPAVQIEGERKYVTIMFSDLSGYTAMTERLDPEEVKEIMSKIFGKITEIIQRYDGFIERFIGDAVMAVFGVPKAHEDDPVRAIRAAMEIHAAVEGLSPGYVEKIGRPLAMHTGINTGLVVTGNVDAEKGAHGLTGDAINLASRLEGIAQAGEIVVGPDTYMQTLNYFEFDNLPSTVVKGKKQSVSIYKFRSAKKELFKTHRLHGLQAALTGRDKEMKILAEAAGRLQQGLGSVISICGDAGTGKSRLKREFKDSLDPEIIQWREGHAYGYAQNMPYYPLINLLTRAFQIEEGDPPEGIRNKIERGAAFLLGEDNPYTPYIGSLFALFYPEIEEVSPEYWKGKLGEAVQALLSALVERGHTVVCFEDLHWADPSFIELLKRLVVGTLRKALFICTYRSQFTLFDSDLPEEIKDQYQEIRLSDFESFDAQKMVRSLLGAENMPEVLNEFVQQKTQGNPFYIEEMINSLIESDILSRANGNWHLTRQITESDIPATIHGLLSARVDRLERPFKRILQEASVIGRAFLYRILERITDIDSGMDECLSGLEDLDLIRTQSMEPELEYIFKHALTQEVVYNGLLIKERQGIHERVGYVIEKLFHNRLPEFYETLAFHFKQGRSIDKATHYLMKAGEKSLNRYALEESHQYYQEAFNLLTEKAGKLKTNEKRLIDIIIKWALAYYYRGDFKGLINLLGNHEDLASLLKDKKQLGMYYAWYGFALFAREQNFKSLHYLEKALQIGEDIEDYRIIGYASTWLVWVKAELGLMEESIHFWERAHDVYRSHEPDHYVYIKSLAGLAITYWYRGDYKKMLEAGETLVDFGHKHSNIRSLTLGQGMTGVAYFMDGDFQSAIKFFKMSIATSADPAYTQGFKVGLGLSYLLGSQFQEAEITLQESEYFCHEFGYETYGAFAEMGLCVNQIVKGQMGKGFRKLKECQRAGLKNGRKFYNAMIEHLLGKLYSQIALGEGDIKTYDMIKNIGFLIRNVPFARKKAETHFHKAIELANEIGSKGIAGQAYFDLGLLNKKKNRTIQAKHYLSEAIRIFEKCESEVYLKQANETLNSLSKQI